MDAAVVIPNFNGERWLPGVLDSVAAQTRPAAEVIVVDDGSTDGSLALLAARHPDVRVLALGQNGGFARAANAGLAAARADAVALVNTDVVLDPRRSKRITRWTARMGGLLARRVPQAIVYVAHAAESHHAARGYGGAPAHVIPNGFDLNEFRPDPGARVALRRELGVSESTLLVGIVGRFHPDKDHRTFLAAAERIHAARGDVRFILCGDGATRENATRGAEQFLAKLGLKPNQLDRLESFTWKQLQDAYFGEPRIQGLATGPVVDGRSLPRDQWYPDAPAVSADVPLMMGSTETEDAWSDPPPPLLHPKATP